MKKNRTDGWVAFKKAGLVGVEYTLSLSSLSSDSSSQLDVLGHDRDSLGVDRAQVGVLEQADQVALAGFLQNHDGSALEPQVCLEVLGNFSDQSLEGQLSDQQLSGLLVSPDLPQRNGSWSVSVRLLHTADGRCAFSCSLGSQLLPGCLSSSTLSCGLLRSGHSSSVECS